MCVFLVRIEPTEVFFIHTKYEQYSFKLKLIKVSRTS